MDTEWIGILGSVMIIIAFAMKSEKWIRVLDAVGAALFILYGATIQSFSTIFLNSVLILVNLVNLRRICAKTKKAA